MSIQNWIKSAYVIIGNPPFVRLEGFALPSVKEGEPPRFGFPGGLIPKQGEKCKLYIPYRIQKFAQWEEK